MSMRIHWWLFLSYSGNTENYYGNGNGFAQKSKSGVFTSGGKIAEMVCQWLDCIIIPGGMPPRSCLGILWQLFYVLQGMKLIGNNWKQQLKSAIDLIVKQETAIKSEAMEMTDFLYKKMPIIYAVDGYNGVATRFRQQINENSKMLCWHHILPRWTTTNLSDGLNHMMSAL